MSVALAGDHVETLQRIPMSYEEYQALPEHPRAEWVDGIVVFMSPLGARPEHQQAARRLANLIEDALAGLEVIESVGIALPRNRERLPDVAAFGAPVRTELPVVETPILVAEVLSPSTRREDLIRKGPEYAEAGIAQYWVVDLDARTIEVQENVDGRWELLATIDDGNPTADVQVGEHGTVTVDLAAVLR
ncbi:Uma2 family endonuclease [Nocardioides humi]|uniref:Putative restriction endonuclease domain-containing protein n=1 Tax=Nocardioides humi TaxID=449461 RepID=A0ABN2BGS5_9ACTN|nr:Uma2 family endonuclease [Nocardioides humi]